MLIDNDIVEKVIGLYLNAAIANGLQMPARIDEQPFDVRIVGWHPNDVGGYNLISKAEGLVPFSAVEVLADIDIAIAVFGDKPVNVGVVVVGNEQEATLPNWKYCVQYLSTLRFSSKIEHLQKHFEQENRITQ